MIAKLILIAEGLAIGAVSALLLLTIAATLVAALR
jgi:tetrahydromethanopterin S-methyltransferase subunit F